MAFLKKVDFYYGAILSYLCNNHICPALIEAGAERQVYQFTTNQGDFKLFAKYRENPQTKSEKYNSWQFVFSENEIAELTAYIAGEACLSVGLVCGNGPMNKSEIAFLHKEEIKTVVDAGKNSLTISRKKNEKKFRVSIEGSRDQAMQVECTRSY